MEPSLPSCQKTLRGVPASPGIAVGKAFIYDKEDLGIQERIIVPEEIDAEIERFQQALAETTEELHMTKEWIERELGRETAGIFEAHLLILQDPVVIDGTISAIRDELKSAEYAYFQTLKPMKRAFFTIEDDYLRQRLGDILDIERRVLLKLYEYSHSTLENLTSEVIVVAHDLQPSDTVYMNHRYVLGFVTDAGGATSHASIIARAMGIPAVVGTEVACEEIDPGMTVIVDGNRGRVYVNPDQAQLDASFREKHRLTELQKDLSTLRTLPAITLDGVMVDLSANIERPEEVDTAITAGARGIGLYRTEFLYLGRRDLPTEDEQVRAYRHVIERMAPDHVVIRTLDLGGDKLSHLFHAWPEMNPFLGWRAIRLCLEHEGLFKTQIRAILRASHERHVRLMFPMISGIEELLRAKEIVETVKHDLRRDGLPFDEACWVGIMIETPSAALIADQVAGEVDFFSIGTNDLTQYTLAVDRTNERVAYLFDHFHPAVLRLIKQVIEVGHEKGIPVAMCGEMSGDLLAVPFLLGVGLDEFSTNPATIPEIKKIIRSIEMREAEVLAQDVLFMKIRHDIRVRLREFLSRYLTDLSFLPTEPDTIEIGVVRN
jgi:phosphotransferase system enzyme I (PtsI)